MSDPKVSVIINCLDGELFLRQAIDSVLHQTFKDWELILWDNASTDGTKQIALSYDDSLIYCCSDRTYPLGTARNMALATAKGEYIAYLDCDDVWGQSLLQKMVNILDKNPSHGMVYSDGYKINEHGVIIGRYFDGVKCYRGQCFEEFFKSGLAPTPSEVLFRRESLEAVHGFDAKLDICEDYDLYLKLAWHCSVEYIPEPLIQYRIHENNSVKKTDILARENSAIISYWVKREPSLMEKYDSDIQFRRFKIHCKLILFYLRRGDLPEVRKTLSIAIHIIIRRPTVWLQLACSLLKRRIVKYYRLAILKYS